MKIDEGFDELVTTIKNILEPIDTSAVRDHVAIHVNVTDMGNRPFYVEISPRGLKVEPFGYFDRDVTVNADSQIILSMLRREADIRMEYNTGRVGAYGNLFKLAILRDLIIEQIQKTN